MSNVSLVLLAILCFALVVGSLALPSGSPSARATKAVGFLLFGVALTATGIRTLQAIHHAALPVVTGRITDLFQHSGRSTVYSVFTLVPDTGPPVVLSCFTDSPKLLDDEQATIRYTTYDNTVLSLDIISGPGKGYHHVQQVSNLTDHCMTILLGLIFITLGITSWRPLKSIA